MTVSGEETVERGLRIPLELQQFPAGLELGGDVPTTVDVRVRGASGALSRVSAGEVIGVLDPALRLKNPRPATVTVQILPAPLERTLRNRPVHLRSLAENLVAEASPTIVDVTVRGSRESLPRVDADEVVAYVDLAGLG